MCGERFVCFAFHRGFPLPAERGRQQQWVQAGGSKQPSKSYEGWKVGKVEESLASVRHRGVSLPVWFLPVAQKVPEPAGSCPARPCLSEPLARSWLGPTAGLSHLRPNLGCVIRAGVVGKGAPREIIVHFLSLSLANSLRAYFSAVS